MTLPPRSATSAHSPPCASDDELEAVRKRAEEVMACENIEAMRTAWKQRWQKFEVKKFPNARNMQRMTWLERCMRIQLYEEGAHEDAAIMAGSTYVASCGAAHLFEKLGIQTDWDAEKEIGNIFRSKEVKEMHKGKRRKDFSEEKGREQKPELHARDFCR